MSFPQAPEPLLEPSKELLPLETDKKKLSDLLDNANTNYTEYHELQEKHKAWIEWYNTQRKIFEGVK
jgi:hypothetical protein